MMKKVIVIGSGIAGLAVSIRLALKGYNVRALALKTIVLMQVLHYLLCLIL